MTSFLLINNIWPEFAEVFARHAITIHEFHSTGILIKVFWINFKFIMLSHKLTLYSYFPEAGRSVQNL